MDSDYSSDENRHSNRHIDVSSTQQQVILVAGHNKWEWTFLSFALISIITLWISSIVSMQECPHPLTLCDHCFLLEIVICTLSGTAMAFAVYGICWEHQFDIFLHLLWMAVALFCSWISFTINEGRTQNLKLSINCTVSVLCIISIYLVFKATSVPDWIEFRLIGVSDPLAAMYKHQSRFQAILKFDVLLGVAFSIYSADFVFHLSCSYWLVYQGLVMLYAISIYLLGKMAINKEDGFFVYAFQFVNACFPFFLLFQMYLLSTNLINLVHNFPAEREVIIMCSSSFVFAIFAVCCKIYLMWQMRKTHQSFGYGLNSRSFRDLVSRNSSNLLAHNRSSLLF